MADDVVVMYCGQVVEQAPASAIFGSARYQHPYTQGLLQSVPRLDTPPQARLEAIPGSVPHPLNLPKGCKFAPRCKYATDRCTAEEPQLLEIEPGHRVRCHYPQRRNGMEHSGNNIQTPAQEAPRRVLLRVQDLKQYFPLKKQGLLRKEARFVRANDGISLEIYEGETFGLVGESGCGKSTLGRTLLQLYHQTAGRTVYYGRSRLEMAPSYVEDLLKHLDARRTHLQQLEQESQRLQEEAAQLESRGAQNGQEETPEALAARQKANEADLLFAPSGNAWQPVAGGFLALPDIGPASQALLQEFEAARALRRQTEKTL